MITAAQIVKAVQMMKMTMTVYGVVWGTSELVSMFDDKNAELVEGGMLASGAHQAAYRCVLPNLRWNITMNYMEKIMENNKLRQDPIHRKILSVKRKLDDNYEPEEAMRYAIKNENILCEKPLAPWVMMNLRMMMMMEMKEVNEPEPMEERTNWTMEMKSIWFWRAT